MPVPDRPVTLTAIASEWGQEVHDYTFAPAGCLLTGSAVSVADNTFVNIPIDAASEDPGGWHDAVNDRAEVPTGKEGLYVFDALFETDDLDSASSLRCYVYVNGVGIARNTEQGDDSVQMHVRVSGHTIFAAGDQITAKAKKIGTAGPSVNVSLVGISFIRVGAEYGA
jgi:hypothetical protein